VARAPELFAAGRYLRLKYGFAADERGVGF
jgi:hypothetical protein